MREALSFFVDGVAKPAGSKRGFAIKVGGAYTGRVAIVDANKNSSDWKTDVKIAAREAVNGAELWEGPLRLSLTFVFTRPKGHYRSGKNAHMLASSAPRGVTSKPDLTKLIRGVEDALTGIVWRDDAQITYQVANKLYGVRPGVQIEVFEAL